MDNLRQRLELRAGYLKRARAYFETTGVLEVQTPVLGRFAVTDPHVDCVETRSGGFLRPSPEYAMKRLLAAGSGDIYELGPVFRDGETGSRHSPEFTLAEWYRTGFDLQAMIDDTVAFIRHIQGGHADAEPDTVSRTYSELFAELAGLNPLEATLDDLKQCASDHLKDSLSAGLPDAIGDDRQAWLDLLLSHWIEPQLVKRWPDSLIVITHYPAEQALLARLSEPDRATAERFEIFYRGYEIANGFNELTDADEQRGRFAKDQHVRERNGQPVPEADTELLEALERGLPDCSGVAVGIERLMMACEQLDHISATQALADRQSQGNSG